MNVLLFGSGGVGVYFAGRLAQGGAKVTTFAHSNFEHIKKYGYEIKSIAGDFHFSPYKVIDSLENLEENFDLILVCTKVLPKINAAKLIQKAVSKKTTIMLIQNGINIEEEFLNLFPQNELISSIAYIGSCKKNPNIIEHNGAGRIVAGSMNCDIETSYGHTIAKYFQLANVEIKIVDNIQYYRWEKLLWNVPFNSISVLGGAILTNQMTDRELIEELCCNLMNEVRAVSQSIGIELEEELVSKQIEFTRNFPPYQSSMLVDFLHKRPLEVDAIIGNVCKIAHQNQVNIPKLEVIYALLKSVNKQNCQKSTR